ncbi:MAG TPA: DEAD/DEAH box helicase, partial [Micromonosporaceae bacterium]|nr:DEAD/DEAH box helicase [Micromonosporaceae bacterium]
ALWGEDPGKPNPPRRSRGRTATAPSHPFAATAEQLTSALGLLATKVAANTATLLLPTRGGRPADSPEVVRDEVAPAGRGTVALAAWRVPVLDYDPDAALDLLTGIESGHDSGEIILGSSVRHLAAVATFARDLVARGRLLPTVVRDADGPMACWRPLLMGPDGEWCRSLALAMPPAARCTPAANATPQATSAARDGAEDSPAQAPTAAAVLADALDALVDAAARAALPEIRQLTLRGDRGAETWRSWLGALTGRQRRFRAEPEQAERLADELKTWQRDAMAGRVRACFRLVEPPLSSSGLTAEDDGSADEWRLEFALQAADQPSLLVDAAKVWAARGPMRALSRYLDDPQETLLAELGRASRLYPDLDEALQVATPVAMAMDGDAAFRFLKEGAPLLAGAGFGVLLPSWWNKPRRRLGARINARSPSAPGTVATAAGVGLNALIDFDWEIALGDEVLTEDEIRTLAKARTPLVRLRGQWVELDPKRLAAALKLLGNTGQMTVAELIQTGLSTEEGISGLPVVSVTADGPLGELLAGEVDRRLEPVPTPDGFVGTLRPYQERGLAWLSFLQRLGLGSILADDMGLGKSATVLALVRADPPEAGPTLLVCPMSLVGNWQREVEKFVPDLRVHVHHGAERARGKAFVTAVRNADLVITTYALAARDAAALAEIEWHRVVVDEAQAIKNAATRQAAAVRSLPARHRVAVTGTPVENRLAD